MPVCVYVGIYTSMCMCVCVFVNKQKPHTHTCDMQDTELDCYSLPFSASNNGNILIKLIKWFLHLTHTLHRLHQQQLQNISTTATTKSTMLINSNCCSCCANPGTAWHDYPLSLCVPHTHTHTLLFATWKHISCHYAHN